MFPDYPNRPARAGLPDADDETWKQRLARALLIRVDPRTGQPVSGESFSIQYAPTGANSTGQEALTALRQIGSRFPQFAGAFAPGAGGTGPNTISSAQIPVAGGISGAGAETGEIANQLNPTRTNIADRSRGPKGSFDTKEECFRDKWWNENNNQNCNKYRSENDDPQGPSGRALLEKWRRQNMKERCADRSQTTARDFGSATAVADYLLPQKPDKWRRDFATVLRTMRSRSNAHSTIAEQPGNTNQGSTFGGWIKEGRGYPGWEDSEYYMEEHYEPSPTAGAGGNSRGEATKGRPGVAGVRRPGLGGTTPKRAVAHVSYLSVRHGPAAGDVLKKNFCLFQDNANLFQVPEIVGIPHSNKFWVFKPQHDADYHHYNREPEPEGVVEPEPR